VERDFSTKKNILGRKSGFEDELRNFDICKLSSCEDLMRSSWKAIAGMTGVRVLDTFLSKQRRSEPLRASLDFGTMLLSNAVSSMAGRSRGPSF